MPPQQAPLPHLPLIRRTAAPNTAADAPLTAPSIRPIVIRIHVRGPLARLEERIRRQARRCRVVAAGVVADGAGAAVRTGVAAGPEVDVAAGQDDARARAGDGDGEAVDEADVEVDDAVDEGGFD